MTPDERLSESIERLEGRMEPLSREERREARLDFAAKVILWGIGFYFAGAYGILVWYIVQH